jgi:5-methylcytosine-specific restriction endonuclease McrA
MSTPRTARKVISRSPRFEVFKRDSCKCQYCGAEAPNILLHIDHVKPVADGGTIELTNLITACQSCNLGKRDVPLAENAAVNKAALRWRSFKSVVSN